MNSKQIIGLIIVLIGLAAVAAMKFLDIGGSSGAAPVTVKIYYGSEKKGFLHDEEVLKILKDDYGITIDGVKMGSLEMADVDHAGVDGLWPSSELAAVLLREHYPNKTFKSANIFNTPIVFYSWPEITDALEKAGVVQKREGVFYVIDCAKFFHLVESQKPWKDLGLVRQLGPVSIHPTDPDKSNSGFLLMGLMSVLFNNGQVPLDADIPAVAQRLRPIFQRLGYLENSTGILFNKYLQQGQGKYPVIAAYESLIVEFFQANPDYREMIKNEVRVLVPEPTVWSEHPFIALTAKGERFLQAAQSPELQRIAWERYGFRSAIPGIRNDPAVLKEIGLPQRISMVSPLPTPQVMRGLLENLQ